uniref:NADH dehydrogenase subunit 4 n=1 Tax=Erianthus versicolor TaxID=470935 RepID=UPI002410E55F|nr:NADH dehydrogenase subunit 4 [Erianthus versicolor]WEL32780.1 NADH dehydrogenase subunit 4 [Erianthus versicolor]
MLKFILFIVFLMPLCLMINSWWIIHSLMFIMIFIFIIQDVGLEYFCFGYFFGMDLFSYLFILLSMWICVLMLTSSFSVLSGFYYFRFFLFVVLFLLLMLLLSFSSLSLFSFYLFFESSIIPTLFLIVGWGYQPERLQAGIYLVFYTLFASLPLLLLLVSIYYFTGLMYMPLFIDLYSSYLFVYLFMIMAFFVKIPLFIFHIWLPKAHVEAPVSGSMILAGVLLKLGGYGLIRVMKFISFSGTLFNYFFMCLCLMGGFFISLICLRQVDIKSLIAYSSVSHMSMVIGGLLTMTTLGVHGSLVLMVGHGLCSSGMFVLSNLVYERTGSRILLMNKGLMVLMPSFTLWWFLIMISNMAAPPSLNLMGELMLLMGIISWSWLLMIFLFLLSFMSALYTIYLYSYSQHGSYYSGSYSFSLGCLREYHLLMMHWFPLTFLFLIGFYFILC